MPETLPQQSYQLRDYQEELVQRIFAEWSAGNRRVLAQSPTGSGKTVLFSAVSRQFTQRGEGVLVLAHREELLLQAKEKLESATRQPAGLIKAGYRQNHAHPVQIASVQSLVRRKNSPSASLVIVDEAHHSTAATYREILERYPDAYVLGVSATPARSDGQGFKNQYDALVLGWSVRRLIEAGYLCPFRLFAAKRRIKVAGIKITAGDYNQRELAELVNTSLTLGDLVSSWRRYAQGKKTVVFCVDVKHSKAVAEAYQQAGVRAEHLDGETPASERQLALERFRNGETTILTNCALFVEGLDIPGIEAVQCLRPTRSLNLHLQMLGRGLRPSTGKEHLIILDHTENWLYLGLVDEEREWSLDPISLSDPKWAIECPGCQHVFRPLPHEQENGTATCPNCGMAITLEVPGEGVAVERSLEHDKDEALEEIDLEASPIVLAELERLKELQEKHRYKPAWIYHQLIKQYPCLGLGELRKCAELCGYKPGWAWYRWQELQQQQFV